MAPPPPPPPGAARPAPAESPASSLGSEGPRPVSAEATARTKRETRQGLARKEKKKERREVGASPGKAIMARKARDVVGFNPRKAKQGRGVRAGKSKAGPGFPPNQGHQEEGEDEEEEDDYEDISEGELELEEVRVKTEEEEEVVCLTPAPPAQHLRQQDGSVAIFQPPIHTPYPMVKTEPGTPGTAYAPDVLNQAIVESNIGGAAPGTPELHREADELLRSSPGGQATPPPNQIVIHHTTNNIAIQYTPPPPPPPPQVFQQVYQSSPVWPPPPGFEAGA